MSIKRTVELILERAAAKRVEREAQRALDRGTDPQKPKSNLAQIGGALQKLKRTVTGIAAAFAGLWGVRQLFDFGKAVFALGADVRAVGNQFRTVFGGATENIGGFVEEFRAIAGLTRRDAQRIAASAGSMARGFGETEESAASFAQQVLKLSGDLASFNNVPTADAAKLVQSALIGNTEAARSLGVSFTAADVQQRALIETGKKNVKQLTQAEKAWAALQVITERAGPQIGDLNRTMNDQDNQAKQLSASWEGLKQAAAAALVTASDGSTVLGDIRDLFVGLTEKIEANQDAISGWSRFAVQALLAVWESVRFVVRGLFNVGQVIGDVINLQALTFKTVWGNVLNFVLEGLDKIPGVDIDFRIEGVSAAEYLSESGDILGRMKGNTLDLFDATMDLGQAYRDVAASAAAAASGVAGVTTTGGAGGGAATPEDPLAGLPSLTGPNLGPKSRARAADALGERTEEIQRAYRQMLVAMRGDLAELDPFGLLRDETTLTAAFMRDGFSGVGEAMVAQLIGGRAEAEFASGLAALAAGIWPPNPAALAASAKHFAAAAAFRALAGSLGRNSASSGPVASSVGARGSSNPGARDLVPPEVNIFIDPFDPANERHQRATLGAVQNAQQRYGENVKVNIHPRTG